MADLRTSESLTYDELFAGANRDEIKTYPVTVAQGQNLKRGQLVTYASGTVSAVTAATDEIFGVLCDDVNATDEALDAAVFLNGDFNKSAIITADGLNVDDFIAPCRKAWIILR